MCYRDVALSFPCWFAHLPSSDPSSCPTFNHSIAINQTKNDEVSGALIIQIFHSSANVSSDELASIFSLDTGSSQENETLVTATGGEHERGVGAWAARTVLELLKGSVAVYPSRIGTASSGAVFVLELPMNRMGSVPKANSSLGSLPSCGDFRQRPSLPPQDISVGGHQQQDQPQLRYLSTNNDADDLVLAVMSAIPPQHSQPRAVMAPIEEGSVARSSKILSFSESGTNPAAF